MNLQVNTSLKLPTAPTTAVYRLICQQLKADPTLSRIIGPDNWQTWDGDPRSKKPLAKRGPAIELTPTMGQNVWWTPTTQRGPLIIRVEMSISTQAVDDVMNLWNAMVQAIYPQDVNQRNTLNQARISAGAMTGLVSLSLPAFDPGPEENGDGTFHALGQMMIDVRLYA